MIRALVAALFLVVFGLATAEASGPLQLDGRFVQGGLVQGRTDPAATVEFEGRRVQVSPDGLFLIGFGRDAPATATLSVRYPDGTARTETLTVEQRDYDVQRIDGLPEKMVTPPPAVLARIRADQEAIAAVRRLDTAATGFASGWIWPVKGPVTGVYGSQRILNGKPRQPHYGVDIAVPEGTPVVAPADGTVTLAHPDMYYTGHTLVLDHGHGLSSAFLHMKDFAVHEGQTVKRGEIIGAVGATGRATGPHLDWRVNLFDTRIDPALLVPPMPSG